MISGEVRPSVLASQTPLAANAVAPPESVKIATGQSDVRKKLGLGLRLRGADATDNSTAMVMVSAGPSSMVATSATSTKETAVMGSDQQKLDFGGLTKLATFSNPDPESPKLSATPPPWCRQSPAEPASPAATTGPTPSARLTLNSAMEVGGQRHVSPPTLDPPTGSTSHKSFQTILSKNQLHCSCK